MKKLSRIRFFGFSGQALSAVEGSKIKNPKWLGLTVISFVLMAAGAEAQQSTKIPRIGLLSAASPSSVSDRVHAFREGLRELGYMEGKNIFIEYRYAEGNLDRLKELAAELVRFKVDLIVTAGPTATRRAKEATATISIVMAQDTDPVESRFVASLARPGGNITGFSILSPEMAGKRLELLKEIVPSLSRVAIIGNRTVPGNAQGLKELETAAEAIRLQLKYMDVLAPKDIEAVFRDAIKGRAEAVLVLPNPVAISDRKQVVNLAERSRLPTAYYQPEYVEAGGLMFYGPSNADIFRRAAAYVDKILKGAKPADLPVEQPKKFEFIVNLNAAKQIGLTIPPNVLARADKVIR